MNAVREPKVFELSFDLTGVAEGSNDAVLAIPEDRRLRLNLIPREPGKLPPEVWFWASLDRARERDLMHNDVRWRVCSRRMLEALEGIGPFPHLAIPAHFKEARKGLEGTLENQFFVLAITEVTNAVDRERTVIKYDDRGRILAVKEWHFKEPPHGLPPVFKVEEDKTLFLLSERAAQVLANFRGVEIKPPEKIGRL